MSWEGKVADRECFGEKALKLCFDFVILRHHPDTDIKKAIRGVTEVQQRGRDYKQDIEVIKVKKVHFYFC